MQPTGLEAPPCPPPALDVATAVVTPDLLAERAQGYRQFWEQLPTGDAAPPALTDQLLRDLHQADPAAAARMVEGLVTLPAVGDTFLGFTLDAELGRGAFARVYLARQHDLADRRVALKITTRHLGEPALLARLQHTNVVPLYSVHYRAPVQAVCMPFLGTATLKDLRAALARKAALPRSGKELVSTLEACQSASPATHASPPEGPRAPAVADPSPARPRALFRLLEGLSFTDAVLWMGARLADALAHAHDQGIVHNDLKPANVLLTDDGQPMLLDFNLATFTDPDATRVAVAACGGTLPYMAPEHLEAFKAGRRHADPRSDVYALGLILFELLANRPPWEVPSGSSLADGLEQLLASRRLPPPALRAANPHLPSAVEAIIDRCLEPDPERRYQSAHHLREDLERQLHHQPLRHAAEGWPSRAGKWFHRHPRLGPVAVAAAALVVVAGLLTAFTLRGQHLDRLKAREDLRSLEADLRRAQALVFNNQTGPQQVEDLQARARAAVERYRLGTDPRWDHRPAVSALDVEEQGQVRGHLGEYLFLIARKLEDQAAAGGPGAAEAEEFARLAVACYGPDQAPRAVWDLIADVAKLRKDPAAESAARARAVAAPAQPDQDGLLSGQSQAVARQFRQALPTVQAATFRDPRNFAAWYLRGEIHLALHQEDQALGSFHAAIALRPEFAWPWMSRGLTYHKLGQFQEALADFDQAALLAPDLAPVYHHRAVTRKARGDYRGALADVDAALAKGPASNALYFLRAAVKKELGDKAGAAADWAAGLRLPPQTAGDFVQRALARRKTDPAGALADLDAALKRDPHCHDALQNKAALLDDQFHDGPAALAVAEQTVAIFPDSVLALGGRGVLLARAGQRPRAIADAEAMLQLDTHAQTLYQAACVYALTSRQEPADKFRAIELLAAALRSGHNPAEPAADPDLDPIRQEEGFRRALEAAQALAPARK